MNEKQTKRLLEMQKAIDGGAVQPEEFAQVIKVIVESMKEMKVQLESKIEGGDTELVKVCKKMMSDMTSMEKKMTKMLDQSSMLSASKMDKMLKQIMSDMRKIEETIPTMPDLSIYEKKLSDIEAKIPVIKDTILDPKEIRDKLETLEEEERLDVSAVRHAPKMTVSLSAPNNPKIGDLWGQSKV